MECQLCGQDFPKLNKAQVEESVIDVCDKCLKFATKVIETKPIYKSAGRKVELTELIDDNIVISPDYGYKIRKARESKGFTREQFSEKINEKESVIKRIEEEEMKPNEELTKRIESFLGVNLREKYEQYRFGKGKKREKLTFGDVVKVD